MVIVQVLHLVYLNLQYLNPIYSPFSHLPVARTVVKSPILAHNSYLFVSLFNLKNILTLLFVTEPILEDRDNSSTLYPNLLIEVAMRARFNSIILHVLSIIKRLPIKVTFVCYSVFIYHTVWVYIESSSYLFNSLCSI